MEKISGFRSDPELSTRSLHQEFSELQDLWASSGPTDERGRSGDKLYPGTLHRESPGPVPVSAPNVDVRVTIRARYVFSVLSESH